MSSAAPVAGSKKRRVLPPSFNHEETSLAEQSARSVVEQYLAQFPERLGSLLARMPKEKRKTAVLSVPEKEMLMRSESYSLNLENHDVVAILGFHDSAADMDYALLKVGELPDELSGVLRLWMQTWNTDHNTADKRTNKIEHDGSATLDTDTDLDALSDAIESYVTNLQEEYENVDDDMIEEGDEPEEFNFDEKMDSVHSEICEWLSSCSFVKQEPKEERRVFMRTPKITIRYNTDS